MGSSKVRPASGRLLLRLAEASAWLVAGLYHGVTDNAPLRHFRAVLPEVSLLRGTLLSHMRNASSSSWWSALAFAVYAFILSLGLTITVNTSFVVVCWISVYDLGLVVQTPSFFFLF